MKAVKTFINQLNRHPERLKLKDKNELKEAFTVVATVDKMGHQDRGAEKKSVTIDDWDEDEDGPLDQNKVVEEVFFGQTQRGCWVVHGRQGVFFRQPIAEKVLENRTEVSDGAGPFADVREKQIKETYSKAMDDKSKKIEQSAVEAPKRATMEDILQLLRSTKGLEKTLGEDEEEEEPNDVEGDDQSEQDEPEESSDDEDFARNRLLNFAGAVPEAAAKSSKQSGAKDLLSRATAKPPTAPQRERHAAQACGPVSRASSGPTGSLRPRFRAGSIARSSSNRSSNAEIDRVPAQVTRPQVDAIELDGRGMRLQDTLKTEIEKIASEFGTLASGLASDTYALSMSLEERKAFEKGVHSHIKELSKLTTNIKAAKERLSKSSNKTALRAEHDALESWQNKVDNLVTFFRLVIVKNPPPHEFITALNHCSSDGVRLPTGAQMMWFGSKAQQAMMQDSFESVLAMCVTGNNVCESLVANGIPRESLPRATQDMFESTILERLGLLTEKDALLATSQSEKKSHLKNLAIDSIKAFYSYYDDY